MRKNCLIIKDRLSKIDSSDVESIKKQTETTDVEIYNIDDRKKVNLKNYSSVVAFNNCLLLIPDVLKSSGVFNFLSFIYDKPITKFVYRRDKNFIGEGAIKMLDLKEIKFIYPTSKTRILIAIPTYQNVCTETMLSVYNLIEPKDCIIELLFISGYTVVQARNRIVTESLSGLFDYTLFVDSDVILPPYLLLNLLNQNSDIATGYYLKKTKDEEITELYGADKLAQNSMVAILKKELPNVPFNVLGCGFGCTLVKNDVFKSFPKEDIEKTTWFKYIEDGKVKCSEDLFFCIKARELGKNIVADPNSLCLHVGKMIF